MIFRCERGCKNKKFRRPQDLKKHYTQIHGGLVEAAPSRSSSMGRNAHAGYSATIDNLEERYEALGAAIEALKRVEDLGD